MEYLFIYLLQAADSIHNASDGIVIFAFFALIISGFLICEKVVKKQGIKLIKIFSILFLSGLFLNFIPTKQTLLLMGGTYLGKKAVNAVITDEKIKKVDTIINLQLDKRIKELQANN